MRTIDLAGPEGNAFCLLATASNVAKQLEWPDKKRTAVLEEMRGGNYEHLCNVFEKHFGDFYELDRSCLVGYDDTDNDDDEE